MELKRESINFNPDTRKLSTRKGRVVTMDKPTITTVEPNKEMLEILKEIVRQNTRIIDALCRPMAILEDKEKP